MTAAVGVSGLAAHVLADVFDERGAKGYQPAGVAALLALLVALHAFTFITAVTRGTVAWWALAGQGLLTYLPLPLFGAAWVPVSALLAGSLLMAGDRRRSPLLGAAGMACGPVVLAVPSAVPDPGPWALAAAVLGLAEYAMVSLAVRAHRLAGARADLIRHVVAVERRRFTRDMHDLVGHRLTVLVLRVELVQRLLDTGDPKAKGEVKDVLDLARGLTGDVRAAAHGMRWTSLEAELASVRGVLEANGVRCRVSVSCGALAPDTTDVLAHVLREGVTNMVRHASARDCVIQVVELDGMVRLSMTNDGAGPPHNGSAGDGQGLRNLTDRAAELGGRLEAAVTKSGVYRLAVFLPKGDDASHI